MRILKENIEFEDDYAQCRPMKLCGESLGNQRKWKERKEGRKAAHAHHPFLVPHIFFLAVFCLLFILEGKY
jgi:hypothetical protein